MFEAIKKAAVENRARPVVASLVKNGFQAEYLATAAEAKERVLQLIPEGATVGVGGSVTVREIGVVAALKEKGHQVYDHWQKGLTPEEVLQMRHKQPTSDVFLSSSNAVSQDGKLVNWDGFGNRVAAMMFGPKKVIVVIGVNKVVRNLDEAISRAQTIAGPMNFNRLNSNTPCAETGLCTDCKNPNRGCNITTIIHRHSPAKAKDMDFHVLIVGEDLGF